MSNTDSLFSTLSNYQQWVLITLYYAYKFKGSKGKLTENMEYLHMEACMSAMVPGFSEDKANADLTDLVKCNLVSFDSSLKEYKIKMDGSILVRQVTKKIHELLEHPDFVQLTKNIQSKAAVANLLLIKKSHDYADTESTMKKLLRLGITHINGFSWLLSLIK